MSQEVEDFFKGATFQDFLLRPRKSLLFSRKEADLKMPLTRNISLPGLPVIPANMRTVTGARMTAASALDGTIAFLPRSYSIEQMVERIRQVKNLHAHIIENPLVIHRKATMGEARRLIKEKKISGILIEENTGSKVLAGILSQRDLFGPDSGLVENYMTLFDDIKFGNLGTSGDYQISRFPHFQITYCSVPAIRRRRSRRRRPSWRAVTPGTPRRRRLRPRGRSGRTAARA